MKHIMTKIALLCTLSVLTISMNMTTYAAAPIATTEENLTPIVTPYSDIIEWRFKVENGRLYQRQYNCTKDMWIGVWELVY